MALKYLYPKSHVKTHKPLGEQMNKILNNAATAKANSFNVRGVRPDRWAIRSEK